MEPVSSGAHGEAARVTLSSALSSSFLSGKRRLLFFSHFHFY